MNRGVIMEVGKRFAVVMTPDGEFRRIRAAADMAVGEEIRLEDVTESPGRAFALKWKFSAGAAAAAVVLLLCVPWLTKFGSPDQAVAAYLTMDINPSIELAVDNEENVLGLLPLNPDAKKLAEGLTYKGQPVEVVAASIMERVENAHYFDSGDGDVVITSILVGQGDETYESELTAHVQTAVQESLASHDESGTRTVQVTTVSAPEEVREVAKKSGVSSGKMAYYLLAKSEGHDVDLEELRHTSIHKSAAALGGVDKVITTQPQAEQGSSKSTTLKSKLKELAEQEKAARKQQAKEQKAVKAQDKSKTQPATPSTPSTPAAAGKGASGEAAKPAAATDPKRGDTKKPPAKQGQEDKTKQNNDRQKSNRSGQDDNGKRDDGQQAGNSSTTGRHDGRYTYESKEQGSDNPSSQQGNQGKDDKDDDSDDSSKKEQNSSKQSQSSSGTQASGSQSNSSGSKSAGSTANGSNSNSSKSNGSKSNSGKSTSESDDDDDRNNEEKQAQQKEQSNGNQSKNSSASSKGNNQKKDTQKNDDGDDDSKNNGSSSRD
ncbi:hypothetical protein FHS18_000710 [Paenibacillus phyllosphaerae]|uniref:RsgI N-terminal anti-sigma domain-containing protein n=1 Tax=Paenibacillus phyllosphaerae TaxID=274593 RepID=A0A7W5AU28_9BACL|nr:anti-sigma factor domain-containing protein [Paenibacillus phyllosphaerae]MBB3108682.1 hypothetical protein [Paenibacillus phyllosphaerae]